MDNAIDAPHGGFYLGEIGEIGAHDLFAGACRIERRDVGKAQHRVASAQTFAQGAPDFPGRAGDQNAIHATSSQNLMRPADGSNREVLRSGESIRGARAPCNAPRHTRLERLVHVKDQVDRGRDTAVTSWATVGRRATCGIQAFHTRSGWDWHIQPVPAHLHTGALIGRSARHADLRASQSVLPSCRSECQQDDQQEEHADEHPPTPQPQRIPQLDTDRSRVIEQHFMELQAGEHARLPAERREARTSPRLRRATV